MKKLGFLLLILCLRFSASGQNLVPNPGFENDTSCNIVPSAIQLGYAPPWNSPTGGTPDIFNSCAINNYYSTPSNGWGFQHPHLGNCYAGVGLYSFNGTISNCNSYYIEYIQIELDSPLINQESYCGSFYINLINRSAIAIKNIGVYFSDTNISLQTPCELNFNPQIKDTNFIIDTTNWTLIYGRYIAHGGERYIIIGNFDSALNTDTIHVNATFPIQSSGYYIDDVNVHCCTCDSTTSLHADAGEINNQPSTIEISPNPATSEMKITTTNAVMKEAHIYTMMGQCILLSPINNRQSTIDISSLPPGMYVAEVISEKGVIRKRFVKQ